MNFAICVIIHPLSDGTPDVLMVSHVPRFRESCQLRPMAEFLVNELHRRIFELHRFSNSSMGTLCMPVISIEIYIVLK